MTRFSRWPTTSPPTVTTLRRVPTGDVRPARTKALRRHVPERERAYTAKGYVIARPFSIASRQRGDHGDQSRSPTVAGPSSTSGGPDRSAQSTPMATAPAAEQEVFTGQGDPR